MDFSWYQNATARFPPADKIRRLALGDVILDVAAGPPDIVKPGLRHLDLTCGKLLAGLLGKNNFHAGRFDGGLGDLDSQSGAPD